MSDRVFLDTNILVYAIETAGPDPGKTATALALAKKPNVCVSTQVLGEFYRAVTSSRRASPLTPIEAVAWVQFWKRHEVCSITTAHVDLALEITLRFKVAYYDGLILAAARLADCDVVYSEDLNDEQEYGGVRVKNPFEGG